jgi:prenyltransferase beta subunit
MILLKNKFRGDKVKKIEEIINDETIDWLLEEENPSVRYFTLLKLLKKSKNDKDVIEAKKDIMKIGIVPKLLSKQNEAGYWGDPQKFYIDKYRGTVWQLMILAEMAADGENKQIKKACEFILENGQNFESYGFSSHKTDDAIPSDAIPCLTGNMLWSLIKLGFLDDERVKKGIEWICKYQRSDDGISDIPKDWPYKKHENCWGKHSCHMGVVKSLKALAAIPKEKRNSAVEEKIETLSEYLLKHHIYKKSHDLSKVSRKRWLKLGFPLMYQSDILEILEILTELGYTDARLDEAIKILENKKNSDNKWKLENSFNGRMIKNIEKKNENSKWITLKVATILINQ